ncbi:MAG: hypothetical protein ACI9MJ_000091, partial [Alphaproteobacteria bacterium]
GNAGLIAEKALEAPESSKEDDKTDEAGLAS